MTVQAINSWMLIKHTSQISLAFCQWWCWSHIKFQLHVEKYYIKEVGVVKILLFLNVKQSEKTPSDSSIIKKTDFDKGWYVIKSINHWSVFFSWHAHQLIFLVNYILTPLISDSSGKYWMYIKCLNLMHLLIFAHTKPRK